MAKIFSFGQDAREKIMAGAGVVAAAVSSTIGPAGKLVVFRDRSGNQRFTKDGVSVAKACLPLKDPFENYGAEIIKNASNRTVESCGDGTSSSAILANYFIKEGMRLTAAGYNAVNIKKGIDFAVKKIVVRLKETAKPIKNQQDIINVGTVSANNDVSIGTLIADAISKVGNDGIVNLQESKGLKDELEIVTGYMFDRGYLSPYFATNEKSECVLENPLILITNKQINNVNVIMPILDSCHKKYIGRPLCVIADGVESEALATLLVNHVKASFRSVCIKNPGFGNRRLELMNDIAILAGAQVVSEEMGYKLENFDVAWLGSAKKVIVTNNTTTIVEGAGKTEDIEKRANEIRNTINTSEGHDKEQQESRLAKFVSGVAQIYVGGQTEGEIKEKLDRFEDALSATKSAIAEGIVPGGGVALLRAVKILDEIEILEEIKEGVKIVKRAVEEPLKKIIENAGLDVAEIRLKILANDNPSFGFNSATEKYEDLMETGVIDPVKVVRCSLENAASVAGLVLTTDCMIADEPEDKKK